MLFQTAPRQAISFNDQTVYDVSQDCQRFLILTQKRSLEAKPMTVVLNWAAELKRK